MSQTKNITGACVHCKLPIEFPAERIGQTQKCPYCRKETELILATPPIESGIPKRVFVWTIVAVFILITGFVGLIIALNRTKKWAERQKGQQ